MSVPTKTCGPAGERILQIHPTLRCNLRCEHCYSSSGPWAREELDRGIIERVLSDAAGMGYRVVSFSGGEPFLYSGLADALRHARALGMRTTVTTNGYFLHPRHLEPLCGSIDVLAVSLDGPPEIHNRMRASPQAFDRLCAGLENLRSTGLNFGFIHTVTRESWIHLVWLAEFAATNGAKLLQLHPLELAGRAEAGLKDLTAQDSILNKVFLLAAALAAQYAGTMRIQTDLLHRDQVLSAPEVVYAGDPATYSDQTEPASQLGILVLEPDGGLVPLTYGFSRRYLVGNAREQSLAAAWPAFVQESYAPFRKLCRAVHQQLIAPAAPALFNWHEYIAAQSHQWEALKVLSAGML